MPSTRDEVESLLAKIRARAPDAEVARLTDQLSLLCRGALAPPPDRDWARFGLTRQEARLMCALTERLDRLVDKEALMDGLYFDRPDAEPGTRIVDILVCKLRKKIQGSGFCIETVWGFGYRARRVAATGRLAA